MDCRCRTKMIQTISETKFRATSKPHHAIRQHYITERQLIIIEYNAMFILNDQCIAKDCHHEAGEILAMWRCRCKT
jgi:hypothetical protein